VGHEFLISTTRPLHGVHLEDSHSAAEAVAAPAALAAAAVNQAEAEALRRLLLQLSDVAEELQAQQKRRLEEMQQVAVELAVAIASRLVHERLQSGDFAVESLVQQAVQRLETNQPVTVYLNPDDLALLERHGARPDAPLAGEAPLRLLADSALGRGDCRAEVGDVQVLTQVREQLGEIRRHLLEALPDATMDRRRQVSPDRPLRRYPDRRHTA
jgi:flagellar biosynthesis/type III secretory pathway protein FliH